MKFNTLSVAIKTHEEIVRKLMLLEELADMCGSQTSLPLPKHSGAHSFITNELRGLPANVAYFLGGSPFKLKGPIEDVTFEETSDHLNKYSIKIKDCAPIVISAMQMGFNVKGTDIYVGSTNSDEVITPNHYIKIELKV